MNKTVNIEILDSVHCKVDKEGRKIVKYALAYKKTNWRPARFGKKSTIATQYLITGRDGSGGTFGTGLLPRVKKYCKSLNIDVKTTGQIEVLKPTRKPSLLGINFREDQVKALRKIKRNQFGRILHPTGTDKTIIELGIVSMFPNCNVLMLAHTKDLVNQLKEAAENHLHYLINIFCPAGSQAVENVVNDICFLGSSSNLIITTIQSFAKLDPSLYIDLMDLVIVDECHHVLAEKSQYGRVMTHNLSPRRYGFTATLPTKDEHELFNQSVFGEVIAELTVEKAMEKNLIAPPRIKLLNIEYEPELNKKCQGKYYNYANLCIVNNKKRNAAICNEAIESIKNKKPTLIIIEKIEHGKIIEKKLMAHGFIVPFISGETPTEIREMYKQQLIKGEELCVIVSRIWMEGISINNLETIIYAAGMKERKKVIQSMGRGLRTSPGKDEIVLVDCLDPYKYLAEHSILRCQTYNEMGWI